MLGRFKTCRAFCAITFHVLLTTAYSFSSQLDLRARFSAIANHTIEPVFRVSIPVASIFHVKPGVRFTQSTKQFEQFSYFADGELRLSPWIVPAFRLLHSNLFPWDSGATQFSGRVTFEPQYSFPLRPFVSFGAWIRHTQFRGVSLLPYSGGEAVFEKDLIGALGLKWSEPDSRFDTSLSLTTFDEVDVFNLNSPQISADFCLKDPSRHLSYGLYVRYRILLGFGRRDQILTGVSVTFTESSQD